MAKKKKKIPNPLLISINKAAYILNIKESTLSTWIKEHGYSVVAGLNGLPCLKYDDFKRLTNDDKKAEKELADLKGYLTERQTWNVDKMKQEIDEMLKRYRAYIDMLIEYHSKLFSERYKLYTESPEIAALLLYAKIINMCNMLFDSLELSYSSAMLIIRTIDEANTLAQYFLVLKDDDRCKKDLIAWFRYEKSPQPAQCREMISKVYSLQAGIPAEIIESLADDLYEVKSKSVHHTYRDCTNLLQYELSGEEISVSGISYKSSGVFRQYDIVGFVESVINNVMQGFLICFKDILDEEKKIKLAELTTNLSFKESG